MASNILKTLIAEGAGEGEDGMYAIASTIVNRAKRQGKTPEQIVDAPKQYSGRWRPDLSDFVAQQGPSVYQQAQRAWQRAQQAPMPGVDHYLTTSLYQSARRPSWASAMGKVKTVGRHTFLSSQPGATMPETPPPEDPVHAKIRHADTLAQRMGLAPLTVPEIAKLLRTHRPVPAITKGTK